MPHRRSRSASAPFVFGLLTVLAGCAYSVDVESAAHRLVPSEDGCPPAHQIAEEARADAAELVGEHAVPRGPLCWYRIENANAVPQCSRFPSETSLDEMRARARTAVPRPDDRVDQEPGGVRCTTDGPVLLVVGDDDGCALTVGSDEIRELMPWRDEELVTRELLAVDVRSPLTLCEYIVEDERTRRPFSCGGGGGAGVLR